MLLEAVAIAKSFGPNQVLKDVSLGVAPGQVVAIMGENGAGKSTLMKILAGVYPAGSFAGEIRWQGQPVRFAGPRDAQAAGIALIHQEIQLVPELTVAANLFLGHEPAEWLNDAAMEAEAAAVLARLGSQISPKRKVGQLSLSEQQLVEIAKALRFNPRLLIFDEPTSSLTEGEVLRLFAVVRELKAQGTAILYISHKLEEVRQLADSVMVLRDGATVVQAPLSSLGEDDLIEKMVGRALTQRFPAWSSQPGDVLLKVEALSLRPAVPGRRPLHEVNLTVRSGEVVGLAGIVGAGRTELLEFLFGALPGHWSGSVTWRGQLYRPRDPRWAIQQGLALVTEDRKGNGLILARSVADNLTLANLGAYAPWGWLNHKRESERVTALVEELAIRATSPRLRVGALSGGNQQKVVLGKWLECGPKLLLLDEPTRGVDVGAKAEIYQWVRRLTQEGVAIVMSSSELPEILGLSDRVAVMADGTVCGVLSRDEASPEKVMHLATGGRR